MGVFGQDKGLIALDENEFERFAPHAIALRSAFSIANR